MEESTKAKEKKLNQLKGDVLSFLLKKVNNENYITKYEEMASLVYEYRCFTKEEVLEEIQSLGVELNDKDILFDGQEDVFIDVVDRLLGYFGETRNLDW